MTPVPLTRFWLGTLILALGFLTSIAPATPTQPLSLPMTETFNGTSLDAAWTPSTSGGARLEVRDGWLNVSGPTHARAHVQRTLATDLISFSGRVAQWGSLYLVWSERDWCGIGQVSPTPFGRLYTTAVVKGEPAEVDHRGIDFGSARYVRLRLGENFIRFEWRNEGMAWTELRTIARPRSFAGAPKLISAGKYYEAGDLPFAADKGASSAGGDRIAGRISDLRVEPTTGTALSLSRAELKALREPKVDPVTATLEQNNDDPSFEKIVGLYPPMKAPREVVGVPAHPLDIGADRLGRLDVSPWTAPVAWFEIGDPPAPLGREGVPFKRRLLDGYIPIVTLNTARDGNEYELTVFGWSEDASVDKPLFAYTRLAVRAPAAAVPHPIALVAPGNKRRTWPVEAKDGTMLQLCLRIKYPDPGSATEISAAEFETKRQEIAALWRNRLASATRFEVPEQRVMEAYRAWLAYSLLNVDTINGYLEPHDGSGFYEEMFGNSVSLHSIAADLYGWHDHAARVLDTQIHFQQANGLYTQVCGLTDPGGFLVGLARHYRMTGDRPWLERVKPALLKQCDWLVHQRAATPRQGVVRGLIKFRPYNDYAGEVYNYLGNTWCAQGMAEAAAALAEIGAPEATALAAEAQSYRADILASMCAAAFEHRGQRLLPLEPDTHRLLKLEKYKAAGYYSLTASPLLGIGLLGPWDKPTTWLVDALEKRGGLLAGVCEFETGIDHAYTYGYLLNELKRGEVRKTLLGFYSMLAFGMTRDTYSPVEVTMIETGENHYTLPHLYSCTDQLRLLRALLLREDGKVLRLAEGLPRAWLQPGQQVAVQAAPTDFGEVSYRLQPQFDGTMRVSLQPPTRRPPQAIQLTLRDPHHRRIASVETTGTSAVKPSKISVETILWHNLGQPVDLVVHFQPDSKR